MKPETFPALFKFYHDFVKILYAAIEAENELPHDLRITAVKVSSPGSPSARKGHLRFPASR